MKSPKTSFIDILIACSDLFDNPFTIAAMDQPDEPAVHVNSLFEKVTGYARDEVIGRNFRFLQGDLSSQEAVRQIRSAIDRESAIHVDIVNYKKDGTPFWNRMVLLPMRDGERRFYLGMQLDVTERKKSVIGKGLTDLSLPEATPHQIHHELRNPLSVIANAYLLMNEGQSPSSSEHLFGMIRRAVADIATYVRDLPWTPAPHPNGS